MCNTLHARVCDAQGRGSGSGSGSLLATAPGVGTSQSRISCMTPFARTLSHSVARAAPTCRTFCELNLATAAQVVFAHQCLNVAFYLHQVGAPALVERLHAWQCRGCGTLLLWSPCEGWAVDNRLRSIDIIVRCRRLRTIR